MLACVQPNPTRPWLATSGIESVVRIWSPSGELSRGGSGGSARREDATDLDGDLCSTATSDEDNSACFGRGDVGMDDDEYYDEELEGKSEGDDVAGEDAAAAADAYVAAARLPPWDVERVYNPDEGARSAHRSVVSLLLLLVLSVRCVAVWWWSGSAGGSADLSMRRAVTSRRRNEGIMAANDAPVQEEPGCAQQ